MKKIISFILVTVFLFVCIPQNILAAEIEDNNLYKIEKGFEGAFLSDSFYFEGMEIRSVAGDHLQLSINAPDPSISFESFPASNFFESNKIRIVLDNQSECKNLDIEIKYNMDGKEKTESRELEIESRSGKKTYYIDFENASLVTEIKLTFSKVSKGNILLYSLSRKYVFEDTNDYIYEENSRIKAVFDTDTYTVSVSGTIGHSTVTKYSGAQIELYRISIDKDASFVLTDQTGLVDIKPISIQFNFSVNVNSVSEAYSQYVLVVCSTDGKRELLTAPIVPGNEKKSDRYIKREKTFKGVSSEVTVDAIDVNPSLVVLDVYLDLIENKSGNGYYYSIEQTPYYFDREYINKLDKQIKAYTDTNCEVYLAFRLESKKNDMQYKNAYDGFWKDVYAYTCYLTQRYNSGEYGNISGIIVGENADRFDVSNTTDIRTYLKFYSMFLYIVSEAVNLQESYVKLFVPISDIAYCKGEDTKGYESEQLLLSLTKIMDTMYSNPCDISMAIYSEQTPYVISGENVADESYVYYTTEKIKDLERMLTKVAADGLIASRDYLFIWSPSEQLSGSMMSAAYTYNYIKLFFGSYAKSFVVYLDDPQKLTDLKHLIKYIDTSSFSMATEHTLDIIGVQSWKRLVSNFNSASIERFRLLEKEAEGLSDVDAKGSYDIWKFSELNGASGWYSLNGSNSLSINVSSEFGRCLVARLLPHNEVLGEYSSIIYAFDEPKDISFADHVVYSLGIGCEEDANALFELKLIIGSENEIIEATKIIKAGSINDMVIDISELDKMSYMQINVKPISNQEVAYNLYLSKISEVSATYTSEELLELEESIAKEEEDEDNPFSDVPITRSMGISFLIILAIIIFAFVIIFKKVDKNRE